MPIVAPTGVETLVNSNTDNSQLNGATVALGSGRYMLIWTGPVGSGGTTAQNYANSEIRAQIFNADGTLANSEFVVNTTTSGPQLFPQAIKLSNGNVLVAWLDGLGPLGGATEPQASIRAQEFDSNGSPVGSEVLLVSSATNGIPFGIAPDNAGGSVVTYQVGGLSAANPVGAFFAQRFDASNVALGSPITIDNSGPLIPGAAFVTVESDNDIVIAWRDANPFNFQPETRISRYNSSGALLSTITPADSSPQAMVTLATGGFALVYATPTNASIPTSIYALINSADGTLSENVLVATLPPGTAGSAHMASTPSGGFVVTWIDGTGEIRAQVYNGIGNPIGSDFLVNTTTAGGQGTPRVVVQSNGDFVISWTDTSATGGDISGAAVRSQRYHVDPVNQVPTTSDFTVRIGDDPSVAFDLDPYVYDEFVGPLGYDADGDPLLVTAVSNAVNGTVSLNPDGTLRITPTVGAPGPLAFDYTVSDGMGGTDTARATLIFPNDYVTMRAGSTTLINFLANDYYVPQPGATAFTLPQAIADGSVEQGRARFVSTAQGTQIFYDPLAPNRGTVYDVAGVQLNSSFFNLAVGNTQQVFPFTYQNNQNFGTVFITMQGWAQLGGTGADNFVGTADADHLSGGTGAANTLAAGAGNDWYTVRVAGDSTIENAGEGTDSVRTDLTTYALQANVENVYYVGPQFGTPPSTGFTGIGNDLNNVIVSTGAMTGDQLYGLGGDDRLVSMMQLAYLSGGEGNDTLHTLVADTRHIMLGGNGDDIYIVNGMQIIVEYAGQGFDTVRTSGNIFLYPTIEVERVEAINTGLTTPIYLTGNELAQTLVGNNAVNYLEGRQGSDTYTGGGGVDYFYYTTAIGTDIDNITDFTSVDDLIFLEDSIFTGMTLGFLNTNAFLSGAGATSATTADHRIIHDSTTGNVYFDADGVGGQAAIQFANTGAGTPVQHYDFFVI